MPAVTISFCLDAKRDRDLLDWLNSHKGSRSALIRETLRQGLGQAQAITVRDIRQAIRDELAGHVVQVGGSEVSTISPEPAAAAANLDDLGRRLEEDWR